MFADPPPDAAHLSPSVTMAYIDANDDMKRRAVELA